METTDYKKILIVGGGPAGLTASYELSKKGVGSIVFEKDMTVGGISRTVNYKGYHFDIGGHRFFTKNRKVYDMWESVLGDDLLKCNRLSRIYYNNRFFFYPLRPLDTLSGLGVKKSILILASYLYSHLFPANENGTFEIWVSNRFGRCMYETFFKTYTEKVWGIPCDEIRAEWAEQRMGNISLKRAIIQSLTKPNKSNGASNNVLKTMIDSFYYPKFGPGMMWQAVADIVSNNGSKVYMGAEVEKVLWKGNRIEALEINREGQKELYEGEHFISSMPLRELINKFSPPVDEKVVRAVNNLNYRDFLTVALIINKPDLFPDNWIYIHDPGVRLGRIQNFKNWSSYMVPDPDNTCLGLEYFCFEGDDLWILPDHELIEFAKREIGTLGLVKAEDVIDGKVVRMPKAYPIYDNDYTESLRISREFLEGINNLQVVGRNGMHRYNNQDHSMITAMLAVENIFGADHDLWDVNEEQEYHEEEDKLIRDENVMPVIDRMDKLGFATAIGTVSGLLVFISTILIFINGSDSIVEHFQLLDQYMIGYTVSVKGAFAGFAYSFFWGFLFGWLFAYLRNFLMAFFIYRMKKKMESLSFKYFLDNY